MVSGVLVFGLGVSRFLVFGLWYRFFFGAISGVSGVFGLGVFLARFPEFGLWRRGF